MGILIFPINGFSSEQERYFHYTETDGLPGNMITRLKQDQYGYLWVGTTNGIARYDGKNFYYYKELNSYVIDLLYDSKNILWVASYEGIFKYNRLTNLFEQIVQGYYTRLREENGEIFFLGVSNIFKIKNNKVFNVYASNDISDFCFTKEGIWLGKKFDGVWLIERESDFKKVLGKYLPNRNLSYIFSVNDKLFAAYSNGQLFSIFNNGNIKQVPINNHYFIYRIIKVGNEIWVATDGYGIIVLDENLNISRILNRRKNTDASINSNSICDILPGSNNEVWIASFGAGLTCILPDNLLFKNLLPEKGNENSLISNEATSVFEKQPNIYLGTNYGLSVWNEGTNQFKNLESEHLRMYLKGNKVTALHVDQENNIWVATYEGLLGKFSSDFKLLKTYNPGSNPDEILRAVQLQINNNNLLILTQSYNRTLINFDMKRETSSLFELNFKGSKINYCLINSLRENHKGELLAIINDKGLFHVNLKDNVLENKLTAINKQIKCNVTDFYNDKKGNYWIGTSGCGLLFLSEKGNSLKNWTIKDGLPSNSIVRIESVDDRYLWISTNNSGICRFDMQTGLSMNFNHYDGLPSNEFINRVSAKLSNGKLIFGSFAGFTIIDPSKVNSDTTRTEVIISDITFQNQSIRSPEGKQLLKQPLEETKELWLPYNKNSFSIHFFVKSKNYLKYHNYAYRLVGLEEHTNYLNETNFANYTNISPGTYTFEVKSTDKIQGGKFTRLIIHILPPWYLSWYSFIGYAIVLFTILYLSIYAYLKRIALKKEKELNEFKLTFFTNISHDLKTPLTLIDAPVNDLLQSQNLNHEQINKLLIINRNSKRLYRLITDILDFRKISQKQYVLEVMETSVSDILTNITEAFKEECKQKSIDLKCSFDDNLIGYVDSKKIEKILWNLLSNALKFTNKGGTISLNVEELTIDGKRNLKLVVSDNGIGISENDKHKIFERFFKAQNSTSINQEGTGIGLAIVKELVEMHHGDINVDSALNSGTTFTIRLPFGKECYSDNELVEFKKPEDFEINKHNEEIKHYNLPTLLLVEDNSELREYLAVHFEKRFKVYAAEDGLAGLKLAKGKNPDIIVTDIQMPKMNGYQFCKEIRQNFNTSHIPVIMLTASNTAENQIEGLSTGADAYITKPFDIKIFDAQILSLLENRKSIRKKFLSVETQESLEKSLPQRDLDFISELRLFIEENISNVNLNVELLSEHFAMSLPTLYRKIKSLTDLTPNNLIKTFRLRKAYKLIREEGLRASEAGYNTGFTDQSYFSFCFKKEFGVNPSQIETSSKGINK